MPDYSGSTAIKKISLFFITLVIIVLLLIGYFFVGKAEIIITPAVKSIQTSFNVSIKPQTSSEETNALSGEVFSQAFSINDTFNISETTAEEAGKASGQINIINNNKQDQTLVATTRFLTSEGILFRLDSTVVIPAGSQITSQVTADQPGSDGDIKAPQKLTIPGLSQGLQNKIYGEIDENFSGGLKFLGRLTNEDITQARNILTKQIIDNAQINYISDFLKSRSTTTPVQAPEVLTILNNESENLNAVLDDLITDFNLSLEGTLKGVAFNTADLEILALNKLKGSLTKGEKFIDSEPGSLEISLKEIDVANEIALIEVSLAGQSLYTQESQFTDKNDLVGKSKTELIEYFAQIPGVEKIHVAFSPFWVHQVPRIRRQIKITVEEVR